MTFGTCKLTGTHGTLVKCHLLPKALTSPPERNEVRVEGGEGRRPVARYDSWFDKTLVTRKGEDVLADLDTFAIAELRRHKLVWSSWGGDLYCPVESQSLNERWGVREVSFANPVKMRRFCLSLLWRAALTDTPGFSTVTLPDERIKLLTELVLSDTATEFDKFPVHLIQLRTQGGWHNQTPIKQTKQFHEADGTEQAVGLFRFYMDGLIIHVEDELDDPVRWRYKGVALGESNPYLLMTMPFEGSFQDELITRHMLDAINDEQHSITVDRIFRRNDKI